MGLRRLGLALRPRPQWRGPHRRRRPHRPPPPRLVPLPLSPNPRVPPQTKPSTTPSDGAVAVAIGTSTAPSVGAVGDIVDGEWSGVAHRAGHVGHALEVVVAVLDLGQ